MGTRVEIALLRKKYLCGRPFAVCMDCLRANDKKLVLPSHMRGGLQGGFELVPCHWRPGRPRALGNSPRNGLDCRRRRAMGVSLTRKSAISLAESRSRMFCHSTNAGRGRLPSRAFHRRRFARANCNSRGSLRNWRASKRSCISFFRSMARCEHCMAWVDTKSPADALSNQIRQACISHSPKGPLFEARLGIRVSPATTRRPAACVQQPFNG